LGKKLENLSKKKKSIYVSMDILLPDSFHKTVKDANILLDTGFFIDAYSNLNKFGAFISKLKSEHNAILLTVPAVRFEFLNGSPTNTHFEDKVQFISQTVDAILPVGPEQFVLVEQLVKRRGKEGKPADLTDYLLGANLMFFKDNLLLFTKNTNHFPQNIFKLKSYFVISRIQSLQIYGVYSYEEK